MTLRLTPLTPKGRTYTYGGVVELKMEGERVQWRHAQGEWQDLDDVVARLGSPIVRLEIDNHPGDIF